MPRGNYAKANRNHNRKNHKLCSPSALHQKGGKKYTKKEIEEQSHHTSKHITYNGKSYMVLYTLNDKNMPIIHSIIRNNNSTTYKHLKDSVEKNISIRNGVTRLMYKSFIK